jgi:hypothetical protein
LKQSILVSIYTLHEAFFIEANIINLHGLPTQISAIQTVQLLVQLETMSPGQNCEAFIAHPTHKILGYESLNINLRLILLAWVFKQLSAA